MSCRRGGAVVPIGRLWRHSKWLSNPGRRYLGLLLKLRMYLNRVKTNIFHEWFLKHVEIKHSVNFWNSFYKKLAENSHLCFKMAWIYDAKKLILNSLKVLPESRKKSTFCDAAFRNLRQTDLLQDGDRAWVVKREHHCAATLQNRVARFCCPLNDATQNSRIRLPQFWTILSLE